MRAEPRFRLFYINDKLLQNSDDFVKMIGEKPRGGDFTMTIIDRRTGDYLDTQGPE